MRFYRAGREFYVPLGVLGDRLVRFVDRGEREMLFGLGGRLVAASRRSLDPGRGRRDRRRPVVHLERVLAVDGHLFGGETGRVAADLRPGPVLFEPALGVSPRQQFEPANTARVLFRALYGRHARETRQILTVFTIFRRLLHRSAVSNFCGPSG